MIPHLHRTYKKVRRFFATPVSDLHLPGHRVARVYRDKKPAFPAGTVSALLFIMAFGVLFAAKLEKSASAETGGTLTPITRIDAAEINSEWNTINPASGEQTTIPSASLENAAYQYATDESATLDVEAVLVPQRITIISSSRDGRIADMPLHNGDRFSKGDVLLRYDCDDLKAEARMAALEKDLSTKKAKGSQELFKLEVISDIEHLGLISEREKATAREKLYQARLEHCTIRADFDGRVTNRLANIGEYTRTDRVLMEVASSEPLHAEFLVPSKWLRWINVGAPLNITIGETSRSYGATITRIYGEVDPVSQSIQIVARLNNYTDPLLPGMSGQATLDINSIRGAGISGYLEQPPDRIP